VTGKITATSGSFRNCTVANTCKIGTIQVSDKGISGDGWALDSSIASFTKLKVGDYTFTDTYTIATGARARLASSKPDGIHNGWQIQYIDSLIRGNFYVMLDGIEHKVYYRESTADDAPVVNVKMQSIYAWNESATTRVIGVAK
jgi:hypothetical protein